MFDIDQHGIYVIRDQVYMSIACYGSPVFRSFSPSKLMIIAKSYMCCPLTEFILHMAYFSSIRVCTKAQLT